MILSSHFQICYMILKRFYSVQAEHLMITYSLERNQKNHSTLVQNEEYNYRTS